MASSNLNYSDGILGDCYGDRYVERRNDGRGGFAKAEAQIDRQQECELNFVAITIICIAYFFNALRDTMIRNDTIGFTRRWGLLGLQL